MPGLSRATGSWAMATLRNSPSALVGAMRVATRVAPSRPRTSNSTVARSMPDCGPPYSSTSAEIVPGVRGKLQARLEAVLDVLPEHQIREVEPLRRDLVVPSFSTTVTSRRIRSTPVLNVGP